MKFFESSDPRTWLDEGMVREPDAYKPPQPSERKMKPSTPWTLAFVASVFVSAAGATPMSAYAYSPKSQGANVPIRGVKKAGPVRHQDHAAWDTVDPAAWPKLIRLMNSLPVLPETDLDAAEDPDPLF